MSAALDNRPLVFNAYRGDPLARLVLDGLGWKSWQFPAVYASVSVVLVAMALLMYVIRDGAVDVAKLGGYQSFLPTFVYSIFLSWVGARFYLYFSLQSGKLYQELADRNVIGQSDTEVQIVKGSEHSASAFHRRAIWPVIASFLAFSLLLTMLYSWFWDPGRDEVAKYSAVYTAFALPVWVVGMYMVGMVFARFLSTIWGLRRVLTTTPVEVHPLHPDKCGGLKPVLDYSLATSYLIAMFGIGFVIWAFGLTQVWSEGKVTTDASRILEFPAIWFGVALYVVMAPVAFFGTLWTAHRPMREQKSKMLAQLSDEFNKDHKQALTGDPSELDDRIRRLRHVHQLHEMTDAFPVWPFDTKSVRWFGAVVSSPLAVAAVTGAKVLWS